MELVLIRHGRVAGRRFNPSDGVPLGALGCRQARLTADRLAADAPYDWLIASPLTRARQTADIIGARLARTPVMADALREVNRSEVGRAVLAELAHRVGAGAWLRDPIIERVAAFLATTLAQQGDQRVLVVSHGGFIWGTLVHLFPAQRGQFVRHRPVANCSITRVVITADSAHLLVLNDVSHLGDAVTR